MIANSTALVLNYLLSQRWDSDMLFNYYSKVSYTFTIMGYTVESTLKFIDDTKCKFLENTIFKTKNLCYFFFSLLNTICNLQQLRILFRDFLKNNGYPENFINNCFKVLLDNKHRVREKVITVLQKTLFFVLPYLGPLPLQTRTKLRKSL